MALHGVSIALASRTFEVSGICYRYSAKLNDEKEQIVDLLIGLTRAKKNRGFGLCFLHLRNVRGHRWNHKRVYRIDRELELNLKIRPRKRSKRDKPDALTVPNAPNPVWSMDIMADCWEDGRQSHLLNVLGNFNREGVAIEMDFSLTIERLIRSLNRIIECCCRFIATAWRFPAPPPGHAEYFVDMFMGWVNRNWLTVDGVEAPCDLSGTSH